MIFSITLILLFLSCPPFLQIVERQLDQVLSHWRARLGLEQLKLPTSGGGGGGGVAGLMNSEPEVKPVVLRKRRQRVKSEANWALFYYQFNCDHAKPNLIWNRKVMKLLWFRGRSHFFKPNFYFKSALSSGDSGCLKINYLIVRIK